MGRVGEVGGAERGGRQGRRKQRRRGRWVREGKISGENLGALATYLWYWLAGRGLIFAPSLLLYFYSGMYMHPAHYFVSGLPLLLLLLLLLLLFFFS